MGEQTLLINESASHEAFEHKPVLVNEVLEHLSCRPGGIYIDATVGLGGHAEAILRQIFPGGRLIGIDRDQESLALASSRLKRYGAMVSLYKENFRNLPLILNNLGYKQVDGILVDLGVSSYQLLSAERGFTFQREAPLDMRMDRTQALTAAELVNHLSEDELADIIARYGDEPHARRIARAIVRYRETKGPILKTTQLSNIICRSVGGRREHIHPATRTFQALRIVVNDELGGLKDFVRNAVSFLKPGGRLVIISFHSHEDRIVKHALRQMSSEPEPPIKIVTKKPIRPSQEEVRSNPRARSARMRVCERI